MLGLEVSRLARNNVDWYRLLDLCGVTDTVIGDADGLYHPGSFNDRLLLGLKGTMSEAELHVLRARLEGGIRNKASARRAAQGAAGRAGLGRGGRARSCSIPTRLSAARSRRSSTGSPSSARSARCGCGCAARGCSSRCAASRSARSSGSLPTYHQIHSVLESPVYAGAYAFGKTRRERYVDEHGQTRQRMRRLPQAEWGVLIWDHHPGYIDKATFDANRERIAANTRPRAHEPGGAVREGHALLQGIAVCGRCGAQAQACTTKAAAATQPRLPLPRQHPGRGRGSWCLRVGGAQIDQAVADALLAALTPAGVKAALPPPRRSSTTTTPRWRSGGCRSSAPDTRPSGPSAATARSSPSTDLSPAAWSATGRTRSASSPTAEAELSLREHQRPRTLTDAEREQLLALGADLGRVWSAPTHHRPRPQAAAALPDRGSHPRRPPRRDRRATITIRWRGGAITELAVPLPAPPADVRTDEDTIALLERLAAHYDDATIAGILNRQGRRSATGERFTRIIVGGLRRYRNIPAHQPPTEPPDGELLPVGKAAEQLGVAASTLFRWLQAGFIAGEQDTPGAPWRIRVNDQLRALFVEDAPAGYVPIVDAMRTLGVSRQTVLQRVKRGELQALHVRNGRRKGLRILVPQPESTLFDTTPMNAKAV